ncbi:radical SAM/SPASM domain-containing protein [Sphingomonas bacterium]|uniref:radical SAM protein n=1 Tax=Sphingomonas bacterium TaxID=1895847 RepID=UPI0015774151
MNSHAIDFLSEPRVTHESLPSKLTFAWLEITQHCNLRCRHCYTSSSPTRPHNTINWASVIRQVYDEGCRQIQFIGGEPLTHPQIREFVSLAYSLGFDFLEVFTNAALLDDETATFLAAHRVNVATSFYSTRADLHEYVTLTKGSFDDTIEGIRNAVASGLRLRVGVIDASPDCETHDEKVAFLESEGVDRRMIGQDSVRPVGRGLKMSPFVSQFETLCGACWNGKLAISYDGKCYPCIMSRDVVVGNVREQSISEIVISRPLSNFRRDYGAHVLGSRDKDQVPGSSMCTPDCGPAAPCQPMGCTPSGDCTPYHCSPVQPNCGPNDSGCGPGDCYPNLCNPYNVCTPYK